MPVLELEASRTAIHAELAPIMAGKPDITRLSEIDLQELGKKFRLQKIVFETARDVYDQMKPKWIGNKDYLLAQVIRIVERVLRSDRVVISPAFFNQDDLRRRITLTLNMSKIVQHLWESIRFQNSVRLEPVFDTQRPILSTGDMRPWFTGKPNEHTRRSHVNVCVFDSTWEASEAFALDRPKEKSVISWVKNDHLGFEIHYVFRGVVKKYRPDFLIRLARGTTLVLEVKGQDSPEDKTKRRFLAEWVEGVNTHGGFGRWAWDVSFDPSDIGGVLDKHTRSSAISRRKAS